MPHPAGLPDVFVDRSLGRIQLPTLLCESGLHLFTLAERYGIPADEGIPDTQWLADAGERGEVVLMKDTRVRYDAAEKLAIVRHGVRCFCLSRQDLAAGLMANRFLTDLGRIESACVNPGPFV